MTAKELKAIREQTVTFSRDIGALRHELAALKSKSHPDLTLVVEAKVTELLNRQAEQQGEGWRERAAALEQELRAQREEFEAARRFVQETERRLVRHTDELGTAWEQAVQELLSAHSGGPARAPPLAAVPEEAAVLGSGREADRGLVSERLSKLEAAVAALSTSCGAGAEGVEELSAKLRENSERTSRDLADASSSLEQLRGRLLDCESLCASVAETASGEAAACEARLAERLAELAVRETALRERVERVERQAWDRANELGVSAVLPEQGSAASRPQEGSLADDQRVAELLALRASHAKLAGEVHARHSELKDVVAQERRLAGEGRAALEARLASLEELARETARECERAAAAARSDHARLAGEAKAREVRHGGLEERLAALEEAARDAAEERARGVSATSCMMDQFHRRLADERSARDQHHSFVRELFAKEKEEAAAERSALAVRLDHLERLQEEFGGPERLAIDLKTVQTAQCKLGEEARVMSGQCLAALERLDALENACQSLEGLVISRSEENNGDCRAAQASPHGLAETQGRLSEELRSLREAQRGSHLSLAERLNVLEQAFQDSNVSNTQELKAAQARLEKMQGRWAKVREAWRRDVETTEVSFSDALSVSHTGWDSQSQCVSWISEDPMAAMKRVPTTTSAGESCCE